MMQSNDTKSLNLYEDFDELLEMAQQIGWTVSTKTTGSGLRKQKTTARDQSCFVLKPTDGKA